jgi:hypothetical protein
MLSQCLYPTVRDSLKIYNRSFWSPSSHLPTKHSRQILSSHYLIDMAQHQETDGVKIHFSSEDGYLIVEYLTTGTDHTSKQCRDWHAANMKKREYECVDSEGRYLLKIECDFPFHAGDGESGIIATETREDAIQLGRFFFPLNPTIVAMENPFSRSICIPGMEEGHEQQEYGEDIQR